jgi:hypothetical protein
MTDWRKTFDQVRAEIDEMDLSNEVKTMNVQRFSGFHDPDTGYRMWVSQDRLTKVKLWANGRLTVSTRARKGDRFGTPQAMREEQ